MTENNISLSTAIPLSAAIQFQAGSVVSKEIVRKDTGTVTLFAFDQGQGLSEHTAPFDALVYILDGEAKITISGNPVQVKAGELIIMPANEPHALQAVHKFKMLLVMIRS
jgi:quercetin dioxygenase-like cupin family protein